MDKDKLAHKDVLFKIAGIEHTISAKTVSVEDGGVWFHDQSLVRELKSLAKHEGMPIFLGDKPQVFVSFARIEWMMVAAEQSDPHHRPH